LNVLCAHRSFSSAKAMRLLGYTPQVDYPEGLARTLAWMGEVRILPTSHGMGSAAHPGSSSLPPGGGELRKGVDPRHPPLQSSPPSGEGEDPLHSIGQKSSSLARFHG